jgi:hypothetical protein
MAVFQLTGDGGGECRRTDVYPRGYYINIASPIDPDAVSAIDTFVDGT